MKLRTLATFESSFPDDGEFFDHGDVKRPAGQNIAVVLAGMLERSQYSMQQPEQHSYYGWTWIASKKDCTVGFILQGTDNWILQSFDRRNFLRRLINRDTTGHRKVLEVLNHSLKEDIRFQNIHWHFKKEYGKSAKKGDSYSSP
jgi:hypothetical protein